MDSNIPEESGWSVLIDAKKEKEHNFDQIMCEPILSAPV